MAQKEEVDGGRSGARIYQGTDAKCGARADPEMVGVIGRVAVIGVDFGNGFGTECAFQIEDEFFAIVAANGGEALIAVFILFSLLFPDRFLSLLNFKTILRQFVTLTLFAMGPSIVVVTGSLDLSFVGIWMLGGVLVWLCMPVLGLASIFVILLFNMYQNNPEKTEITRPERISAEL